MAALIADRNEASLSSTEEEFRQWRATVDNAYVS